MATNENVNKVIYGNQTVMDITDTTAEESDVASGEVFYKANGARSVGTLNKDSAVWGNITGTLSDQTDLQIELNRAYTKTASETSSIDDLDVIPVQKISASSDGRRNIKFKNLKSILKTYFDNIYSTFSGSYNDLTNKPTAGTGIAINNNIIAVDADNTPTENSEKPVKSKGVYEVVEQIYADNGVLGAKNLLPNNAISQTKNGVTFTVNADKSVTINGTSTAEWVNLNLATYNLPKGKYIINGIRGGSQSTYRLNINFTNQTSLNRTVYNGYVAFELPQDDIAEVSISVRYANVTLNNVTIHPMLRLASDPDDTYQPYAMTNRELTEKVFEKRTLTNSDNLNNITETGIYGITTVPANFPEATSGYCTLIVQKTAASDIRQIIIKSVNAAAYIYTRSYGGNPLAWTPWYKFTGTVVS